jgi:HK97 gp10 family phage protein
MDDANLQGVDELVFKLRKLGSLEDGKALRKSGRDGMKPVREAARSKIPVALEAHRSYKGETIEPGYAKAHIRLVTFLSKDKKTTKASVGVNKRAYYAVQFVERGTKRAPPHPWLRPAFKEKQGEIKQGMFDSLNFYIVKVCKLRGISSTSIPL